MNYCLNITKRDPSFCYCSLYDWRLGKTFLQILLLQPQVTMPFPIRKHILPAFHYKMKPPCIKMASFICDGFNQEKSIWIHQAGNMHAVFLQRRESGWMHVESHKLSELIWPSIGAISLLKELFHFCSLPMLIKGQPTHTCLHVCRLECIGLQSTPTNKKAVHG